MRTPHSAFCQLSRGRSFVDLVYASQFGRGKKRLATSVSDHTSIPSDVVETLYDGFGALAGFGRSRGGGIIVDVNTMDAMGNVLARISDSTVSVNPRHVDFAVAADQIISASRPPHVITSEGGAIDSTRFDRSYMYDGNGNQIFEDHLVWKAETPLPASGPANFTVPALHGHSWQMMTYGVDSKLRYAQKSWYATDGKRTVFTEYRYDALGRRILQRTRRDTLCTMGTAWNCLSTMDRYVWDGDQLVAELRGPGSNSLSETALNGAGGFGPFYGLIRYTHAGGIDEPLAVWGGSSGLYGIVPHLSWRGNFEAGSDITTGTLLEGGSPPDNWVWPSRYKDVNLAPELRDAPPEPTRWLGSLLEGQVDLNGLAYRRNRYYSPTTGRFTSEDPIGLAGGLNLYGFADGDPVNLSDPFGLCPIPQLCVAAAVTVGSAMGAAASRIFENIRSGNEVMGGVALAAVTGLRDGAAASLIGGGLSILARRLSVPTSTTSSGAAGTAEFEVIERANPGRDGGLSRHVLEKIGGRTNSVTHQVTKNREIIHQHTTHMGRYGGQYRFPDSWTGKKTIER